MGINKIISGNEIRQKFLDFFKERGHVIVPSSSLLPDDPSVLLTSAGMQQFKPYYTGEADPLTSPHTALNGQPIGCKNVASVQKSFRTVDIEEVGDQSHLTFFEMLGNFSFGRAERDLNHAQRGGGYDKRQAIEWAYEFIVKEMGLEIDYATVLGDDKESRAIWEKLGITDVRERGAEDNFWGPTGEEGPCGPTTEIYINGIEIWNIVFNQYYQTRDKKQEPLKTLGIDTGMSLERLAMAAQGAPTIFETDLFKPLMEIMAPHAKNRDVSIFASQKLETSLRIIADHIRGAAFLMADGIRPSNIEQGYILRRIIRRAIRHGSLLNLSQGIFPQLIGKVIELYNEAYPELKKEKNNILTAFDDEQKKFEKCLEKGLKEFEKLAIRCQALGRPVLGNGQIITGAQAFHLYDTYGFPLELTKDLAKEQGIIVDEVEFNKAFTEHKETSRAGLEAKFGGHGLAMDTGELKAGCVGDVEKVTRLHTATHLLHQALREVLGNHVQQRGSDITPERLRFDFTHPQKMTEQEKKKVEDLVNEKIKADLKVESEEMSYHQAIEQGALAFFKEKYPEFVKVYSVGNFSKEICGGPHVQHTGEIGVFRIKKEESSAAGIRRIRAVVAVDD